MSGEKLRAWVKLAGVGLAILCVSGYASAGSLSGAGFSIDGSDAGLSIDGSDAGQSIDGSDAGRSIDGSDEGESIDGSDEGESIDGSDAGFSIDGSDEGESIDGSDAGFSIDGSDAGRSIDGSDAGFSIDGSDAGLSIDGSDQGLVYSGNGDLLAVGRIETVGDGFISVMGQTVLGDGAQFAGLASGATIAVYGSVDTVSGGYVDTSVVPVAAFGSDTEVDDFLRGTVDAVDAVLGIAVVSGVTVDYTGLLATRPAPMVGEVVALKGKNYRNLGLFVAQP